MDATADRAPNPSAFAVEAEQQVEATPEEPYAETVARRLNLSSQWQWLVDALVLGVIFGLLLSYFRPSLLFAVTNTTGGDTGAQIYPPWYLKEHLLPRGLVSGWSPDWYAGYPALVFYFPLVPLFQAIAGYVISYEVSFKLGTAIGTFFLPVGAYIMFRQLRFSFPTPLVAAVLSLGFLFMQSFSIYGGNIPSSLAGEYSYALSMALALVFLGLAYRVATEERSHPVVAAFTLALAALSHLLPVIMVILFAPVLAVWAIRRHGAREGLLRLAKVFGLGFALTAFWSIPFLVRLPHATSLGWLPIEGLEPFHPAELRIYLISAVSALVLAIFGLDRRILVFLVPAVTGGLLYLALPAGHVFNARFLPFWYLNVILVTAYFVGLVTSYIAGTVATLRYPGAPLAGTVVALGVVATVTGMTGNALVNGKPTSFIDDWIEWNYTGYEGKSTFPEYRGLMDALAALPPGRVMWEPSPDYNQFGTTDALYVIPYYAGQPTMEGIHYESSISTPFHFLMAAEVAHRPFNPIPGLPYGTLNLKRGVDHMEMFGIRYYVAWSDPATESASASSRLRRVARAGRFTIFELLNSAQVIIPENQPVVFAGPDWKAANIQWFAEPKLLDIPMVRDGPADWPRVGSLEGGLPRQPLPQGGEVVSARMTNDEIEFTTQAIGQPHWIRTSYFPNWQADGALGPFPASPSLMMVVPTQSEVRLHYDRTWPDWLGLVLTTGAVLGLVGTGIGRRVSSRSGRERRSP